MMYFRVLAQATALLVGLGVGVPAQVVTTPEGTVEFIGLQSWSVAMIRDSMAVHAPTKPLGQCATVLVNLGFPSAAALGAGGDRTLVLVVDPVHAGKMQRRRVTERQGALVRWPEITSLDSLEHGNALVWPVRLRHWWWAADSIQRREFLAASTIDSSRFQRAIAVLERSRTDYAEALSVLSKDSNFYNRRAAAFILAGSPYLPATWGALVDALLEEDGRVVAAAALALNSLMDEARPAVDWTSRRTELRALVAGTNVSAFRTVLRVLERTGTPADARAVLAENSHLVLAMLSSQTPAFRSAAHAFLVFGADGRDLGGAPGDWEHWIDRIASDV